MVFFGLTGLSAGNPRVRSVSFTIQGGKDSAVLQTNLSPSNVKDCF